MKLLRWMWVLALVVSCSNSAGQAKSDEKYAEAMQVEHADEVPAPSGAEAQALGSFQTTTKPVQYGTVDGAPVSGFLAEPDGQTARGGVIMIHEWWGLNDNVREMATKLASHGYVVLAVDMYGGKFGSKPEEAKALMTAAMATPQNGVANLKAARAFLAAQGAPKVAVMGWCFGGGWSLEAALTQGADIAAVVMYYGRVKTTPEELAPLTAPLLGIFAAKDQGIPVDQVKLFEASLEAAGKEAQIHVYDGVDHAFANPSGDRYSKEAADDAWSKTLAFLEAHL